MIALRVCALGDLVVSGPLLERLGAPFLVAHAEHVELARAAGWISGGIDADLSGLHALHGEHPDPARLAPELRRRLGAGEPVLLLSRPGPLRDTLVRGLRVAGASEVSAHDPLPAPGVHAADHLAAVAGPVGSPAVPRIGLPEELRARGRATLRASGLDPGAPPIALHPGAGSEAKRWPVARWASAWQQLRELRPPLIVCGPADGAPARELADRLGAPLLRDLPLLELAAALAACRALLGHDSGISHLAAALGTATLALFGPTSPAQWAPRGPAAEWLRAPGGRLADLRPDAVVGAARRRLQTSSR